jgi:hypothetical protein
MNNGQQPFFGQLNNNFTDRWQVSFYPPLRPADLSAVGGFSFGAEGGLIYSQSQEVQKKCSKHAQNLSFFITRAKDNLDYHRLYYRKVDKTTGLRCDQTITLKGYYASKDYPAVLRRISYFDAETGNRLVFLTNNFMLPALTIVQLYKRRWQIEIFFKWIKQYLHIKTFFGTTENAVKTQIWIAISVYVLVAIIKKELNLELSLGEILQILSIVLFEKVPISQVLTKNMSQNKTLEFHNQLLLFNL